MERILPPAELWSVSRNDGDSASNASQRDVWTELNEQLRFERLITDLSSRFVHLRPDQVDMEIESAMRQICEVLELDRCTLAKYDEPAKRFQMTHRWAGPGIHPMPDFIPDEAIPWIAKTILKGDFVQFSTVDDIPEHAPQDREITRNRVKAKSGTILPLCAGGKVLGGLAFDAVVAERHWSKQVTERLQLVTQVFANALERKRSSEELQASQEKIELAVEAGKLGLWEWQLLQNELWISEQAYEIFGWPAGITPSYELFLSSVHPDDREQSRSIVARAMQGPTEFSSEYRIVKSDGQIRWVSNRGRSFAKPNSTPWLITGVSIDITERKLAEQALQQAYSEIKRLKEQLETENLYLREEIKLEHQHHEVVGSSELILRVMRSAEQVAPTDSTVLLLGETGTGKELVSRAIHEWSRRCGRPMVKVNCAALPATLVESELFGREKGAYTGALTREIGRFELANGSTLFLDEIGELPLELQAKLLRVLQEGEFERLGSSRTIKVDVRVIAATSRDLKAMVKESKFREDLFYRISVFPIELPPLRERKEDIPMLVWHFLRELGPRMGRNVKEVRASTMKSIQAYAWPGNVRELRNVIERHLITNQGPVFEIDPARFEPAQLSGKKTLEAVEQEHIIQVLKATGWRIRGSGGAAEVLDINPSTLESRMKKLGIARAR
jgi:PAS domain S-box-containing protein